MIPIHRRMYGKSYTIEFFGHLFDFDLLDDKETVDKCKRWYIKIHREKQPELARRFPKFKIAGDCIFNFNDKKVDIFKNLINKGDKELLEECHAKHHSLVNFSFMSISGGLNNKMQER